MKHEPSAEVDGDISLLDLFNFPDLQREILLCLACYGPADATTFTQSLGIDPAQVQGALAVLLEEGRVRLLANGQVDAVIGRVKGRTTLPAQHPGPAFGLAGRGDRSETASTARHKCPKGSALPADP